MLLSSVLHLCLRKKEPSWLLKNSRPVLLEPFLRRMESTAVFRRLQRLLELRGGMPSCMLAYRRQLSPQQAALLGRALLAAWTADGSEVHIADWDENQALGSVCGIVDSLVIPPGCIVWNANLHVFITFVFLTIVLVSLFANFFLSACLPCYGFF